MVKSHLCILLVLQFVTEAAEVGVDVGEAVVLSQREEDAGRAAAFTLPAEAAVTDPSAARTLPLRIQQGLPHVLSVSVPQTRPTELTLDSPAGLASAARLSVHGLLTALVTRGARDGVVLFFCGVVSDQQQLVLCDVLHWSDDVRFALLGPRGATTPRGSDLQQLLLQAELHLLLLLLRG